MKPPAFQFYPDDFIGGTCDLSAEEVGAYIRLLCYQWSRGGIPDDPLKLARIAGANVTPDTLQKFPDGKNARLEFEREKQAEYRAKQSAKGQASAKARFNRGSTVVQPSGEPQWQPEANSPSPSPSPSLFPIPDSKPLETATPSRRKVQKEKPAPDPRHQTFIKAFCDSYLTAIGQKIDIRDKKHGVQMSRFLKAHPEIEMEEWQAAIDWCYQVRHEDRFARGPVHNISNLAAFCANWSSLVAYHQIYKPSK